MEFRDTYQSHSLYPPPPNFHPLLIHIQIKDSSKGGSGGGSRRKVLTTLKLIKIEGRRLRDLHISK